MTIVARPAKGLETKLVMPMALPLSKTGNKDWLILYPKLAMLVTYSLITKIIIGRTVVFQARLINSFMRSCDMVKNMIK